MLLERLANACGLAGHEDEVRAILKDELAAYADELWTDPLGNLILRKGSGPVKVMLDAHMDEVGFLVGSITDQGYLLLKKVGSLDDRVLPGRQVHVTGRRIPGVIGAKAWHLTSADERTRAVPFDQIYVDLGCRTKEEVEALGVEPGDPVYFAATFEAYSEKVMKGKAFDDRVGCAVVARVLQEAQYEGLTLYAVFTTQEEVGLRGARVAAWNLNPDLALAIDGTAASDVAGVDPQDTATNMGEGPVLYLAEGAAFPSHRLVTELIATAQAAGLPYQFKRATAGGTDSAGIGIQRGGVPACPLSVPCRYIHASASLCHLDDIAATVQLIHRFLGRVEKGEIRL